MRVFVVQHQHDLDGCDEVKFIGVYSTEHRGRAAVARAKRLPGFRDHPAGFSVDAYEVDKTHWVEGFKTFWLGKARAPSSRKASNSTFDRTAPAAQRRAVRRMGRELTDSQKERTELLLRTNLPLFECAHRLRSAVDEPRWALLSLSGYAGSKAVIGTVDATEARLQRRSRLRHPWEAVFLHARLVPDHSGTRIEGRFRRRRSQVIFMGLWTAFAIVVGGILFLSAVMELVGSSGRWSGNPWVGVAVPLIFWAAAASYFWRGRRERRFLTAFVVETVGAEPI